MSNYIIEVTQSDVVLEQDASDYTITETGGVGPAGSSAPSDHTLLSNIGANTHAQIDTHIADTSIHYAQSSIDHTNLLNIGTNTHAQIDTHIANTQTALDLKVDENSAIVGATKTKITYDAKGLVTAGADATTADINDSTNRRYVTDADLVDIGNLSGTNSGDQTITLTGDVTGSGTGSFAASLASSAITGKSAVAAATGDSLLISDVSDSGNLKKTLVSDILSLVDLSSYVPYTGATGNVDLGVNDLTANDAILNNVKDASSNLILKTSTAELYDTVGGNVAVDLINRKLVNSSGTVVLDWSDSGNFGVIRGGTGTNGINIDQAVLFISGANILDWASQVLYDGAGVKVMDFSSVQRQLFDFGGSYPSVDYGNYQLYNIGITNNGPMLDWAAGTGGVKIYSYYSGGYHNSGDFVNYQLNNPAGISIDWALRALYDNTYTVSVDWDYHLLSTIAGTSIDWQNKYLYSNAFGGVIAVDYGNHYLNNGGGFRSIDFTAHQFYDTGGSLLSGDYTARQLFASDGTTVVLNWATQQLSSGAQTAGGTYGATEQTMIQEMYDALRAYGLLS
jgi:hypothetical protein